MTIVGLTGGIASGKTSILNFIKKQNIPTHDSDAVVTSLYNKPSKEFISYLKSTGLSKAVKQKKIDKALVKNEVLNNRRKLKKLEEFIHKKVKLSRDKFIKKNKHLKKKIIVLDIPLLFEKKLESICDYILLAHCPFKVRIARALRRKNLNRKNLEKFIKLQMPNRLKINKSDFIINTSITKSYSNSQTLKALNKIRSLTKS